MITTYDLALIIKSSLSEGEIKKSISDLEKYIESLKGQISDRDDCGVRKMAMVINKEDKGYYYFLTFSVDSKELSKLDEKLHLESNILRYLVNKL